MIPATTTVLPEPAQMSDALARALPQFQSTEWVETTTSTNADLIERARSPAGQLMRPWLLGAHFQLQGRGRSGRTWQNRRGANLMFSCAYDVFVPPRHLPTLSPVAGLLACEALRGLLEPRHQALLTMKWPNDLHWKFAKLAGILIEATRAGTAQLSPDHHVVIIGMGINLDDARALSQSLNRQVADWSHIAHTDPRAATLDAVDIVAAIARAWYDGLNDITARGFTGLPARYAQVDELQGTAVTIQDNGRLLYSGIADGINEQGELLLRTPEGNHAVSVGEVSVRPRRAD